MQQSLPRKALDVGGGLEDKAVGKADAGGQLQRSSRNGRVGNDRQAGRRRKVNHVGALDRPKVGAPTEQLVDCKDHAQPVVVLRQTIEAGGVKGEGNSPWIENGVG